jgi:hypothetical protein
MNCEWVRDNISAYIDGELSAGQKEMIDMHLSECRECKAEFNRLSTAWDSLDLWEDEQPPVYLKGAILNAVKREKSSRRLRIFLPVAAVFVIAFSIFLFYGEINHYEKKTVISENTESQQPIQIESTRLDEEEIIKNLQIIENQDFFDSVGMLKEIDYLPVVEDHDDNKSSMKSEGYLSV